MCSKGCYQPFCKFANKGESKHQNIKKCVPKISLNVQRKLSFILEINIFTQKNIFLDPFFIQFYATKNLG